ncbi:hypothetical protein FisN_2Lh596 [Fistulifera solaris]|uniref:Uncharacterized protein n=1 Tax=Fistulifera solaris TaxID=1519565 RepID=A0A1Z5JAP4_FISSO|nr:hypothetical protein FisN_2Lh596 [Fistulifera solaris]|eukprot:GAX11073.1 hypothetical protein FisN_2Lh596 [Fistulifera solaris]
MLTRRRRITTRYICWCLIIALVWSTETRTASVQAHPQSTIHTYFDENDEYSHELLKYWEQSWQAVGWETAVLNKSHIQVTALMQQYVSLPSLQKWIAMATRGGHYCHWDVFPLTRHKKQDDPTADAYCPFPYKSDSKANASVPVQSLPTTLVVHEVIAPTCMSGTQNAWEEMTSALYEHAQNGTGFWTDALALVDLRDQVSFQRGVLQLDDSLLFFSSPHHYYSQQQDPCRNLQRHIQRKRKWAVQFNPATLQRSRYIPEELRHPQHRLDVTRSWFEKYKEKCWFDDLLF